MAFLIDLMAVLYVLCALALALFSSSIFVLLVLWWWHRHDHPILPQVADGALPSVTVQLPIYNEYAVVGRLIDSVAALDYPRDRFAIQVLDDSDDETRTLVAQIIARHRANGLNITHVRRPTRTGYKAGALAYGLEKTDTDLIVVFDADFVPKPDFLRQTAPYFATDPRLGILQARWSHLNPERNMITRSQAMSIDGHFVIEQTARSRGGLLLSFNGTGGIWRRTAIEDAGGWADDTVTEDLDLSYRAQMRGWRYLYLPNVEVPAELPPQIAAYKRQQARWAKGTTQNLVKLLPQVWRCPRLNLFQKIMATLHLCQYVPQPLLLILAVLTPPLMWAGMLQKLPLAPLGIAGIAAPLMYLISQKTLYRDWVRRLVAFPLLLAIGSGVVFNNTIAVLEAFSRRPSVFKRTPKFSDQSWQDSKYALRPDWTIIGEAMLAVYATVSGIIALRISPGLAPFLFAQTYGFGAMVVWGMFEGYIVGRHVLEPQRKS